ncbi:MAG: NAD(P)/FAD-dependent oxidoreductase [Candidatus Gracilibacteria bacterium]|nr:NAD(P)/FAD-dependent oxidoreductase [Candidatus Gracilibacteria bacterium]MDQ7022573.1 NAD(P)/FAD-dependent oxidoreductase [Candidatus Gracilibacteria bacterium]
MIYDVIIVGAGAAGLFAGINLPKKYKKLILEKNKNPGIKVLLSGGERANVSNMNIDIERDYFTQNKKALFSVFKKYNQWDIQSFFAENGINIIEEDRGRLILESGDSKELLNLLIKKAKDNKCEIKCNSDVKKIEPHPSPLLIGKGIEHLFKIETEDKQKYQAKNVIVSSGGKSFFQVGTTGEGYSFAKSFGLNIIEPTRALVGLSSKRDFKELSGSSLKLEIILKDKPSPQPSPLKGEGVDTKEKIIYSEYGPLLFTHFGISGPIVFNTGNALGEYLSSLKIESEQDKINYILENINIELKINPENSTKKINKFFEKELEKDETIEFGLQDWRSWKEAKATGGGIDLNELDKNFMSKKAAGLYFIGEVVDVTGKTGGFNLQWAWSSGFICGRSFGE